MRRLTDHLINPANEKLVIEVTDEPGAGGANHRYEISGFDATSNSSAATGVPLCHFVVMFQNGAIPEKGVNGVTQEALLAIIIDRLRSFQAGPFACRENAIALTYIETGLMWLKQRTLNRLARGVEGTHQK